MLRQRSPAAYRDFLARWRDLHQPGVAARLLAMDDIALRARIERIILDQPAMADLHDEAQRYLQEHGETVPASRPGAPAGGPGSPRPAATDRVRLRRRARARGNGA
jgi:hypothetical protein